MKSLEHNHNHGAAPLVGRGLLAAIFVLSALGKLTNFGGTAAMMTQVGFPLAEFFLAGAITFELVGGLALLTGYQARFGAALLIAFLIPTTLIFHNFWAYTGADQQNQMINFLKNVSIGGGLLYVAQYGAGAWSVDGWLARRAARKEQRENFRATAVTDNHLNAA